MCLCYVRLLTFKMRCLDVEGSYGGVSNAIQGRVSGAWSPRASIQLLLVFIFTAGVQHCLIVGDSLFERELLGTHQRRFLTKNN